MLHHFIRLLGFNDKIIQASDYILTKDDYPNVFEYAEEYFNCPGIESIALTHEEEWYYESTDDDVYGLYFPKALFAGELLTKFEDSEEHVLSGFTWAFLKDQSYLRISNEGELKRFGKGEGCQSNCDYFASTVYGNDFWDCSVCLDGYFRATESSESETYCEKNGNKDYYFLYNQESLIYKKCESAIANCQKCSSQTICTLCKRGYELDEEDGTVICEKEEDDDDDDGLSTGAIIGIVFGCIGFLAIVALIIICLLKRRNNEKGGEIAENEEEIDDKKKDVETEPKNVQDLKEDDVKVMNYNKNNEVIDSGAEIKKDNA